VGELGADVRITLKLDLGEIHSKWLPYHHRMACPHIANGEMSTDMKGNSCGQLTTWRLCQG
jgi:hypothetical protein